MAMSAPIKIISKEAMALPFSACAASQWMMASDCPDSVIIFPKPCATNIVIPIIAVILGPLGIDGVYKINEAIQPVKKTGMVKKKNDGITVSLMRLCW